MTISSTNRIAGPFIGAGTTATFPFTFKVFSAADLAVVLLNVSTGVETVLTLTTNYTVSLNGNQNTNPGGSITLVAGNLAAGFHLTITSDIENLQPTDLTNQGGFYPEVINDALDRATIQIQQLADDVTRSIQIPTSDGALSMELPPIAQRLGKYMAFDSNGQPVVSSGTGADSGLRTDLANATIVSAGAGLVGFRANDAASTARTVLQKLRDVVSVKDFGAAGDGVADDTAAINAAIAYAATGIAGATGATVYFPTGTYLISATITLPNRVALSGSNNRGTVIKPHSSFAASYMFNAVNGTSSMFGSYLRDMYIDARGKNMTAVVWSQAWQETCGMYRVVVHFDGTTNYGVLFTDGYGGAAMTRIEECEIYSGSTFASAAGIQVNQLSVVGGFVLTVRNCTIAGSPTNTLPYGIRLANDSCDIAVYHGEYVTSMLSCNGVGAIRAASLTGSGSGTVNLVTMESTFTGKMALENLHPNGATGQTINDDATGRDIPVAEGKISNFTYGQPFVSAYVSSQIPNVTGNGTQYTIVFDTEIADYTTNYNNTTGIFGVPLTGKYLINTTVKVAVPAVITTYIIQIVTSNRIYHVFRGDTDNVRDGSSFFTCCGSVIADLDRNDTARVSITVTGVGSDTVDIEPNETTLQIAYLGR